MQERKMDGNENERKVAGMELLEGACKLAGW
jgi:hypothetical protein